MSNPDEPWFSGDGPPVSQDWFEQPPFPPAPHRPPPPPPPPPAATRSTAPSRPKTVLLFLSFLTVLNILLVVANVTISTDDASKPQKASVTQSSGDKTSANHEVKPHTTAYVARELSPSAVQIVTDTGLGSGFIYDTDGLIMTAAHVVEDATAVSVQLSDGRQVIGSVVAANPETDVAVVRIAGIDDIEAAPLAPSKPVVGEPVVALGSPYGLTQTITQGIVSAVGRAVPTKGRGIVGMIQTDAPINPGNSGGMLANMDGEVIGINDAILSHNGNDQTGELAGNIGVGFAIPINLAKAIADKLVAGEAVSFGMIGAMAEPSQGERAGALIRQVTPGGPAEKAGVKTGDIVVKFDDEPVSDVESLIANARATTPGETVSIAVLRGGHIVELELAVGQADD